MKSIWELGFDDIISPALQKVQGVAKSAFANLEHMELGMKKHTEETTHSLHEQETMLGSLREAAVEFFAVEKFMEMGSEIMQGGMALETARANMQTYTGSVAEGNEAFEKLIEFHEKFPIVNKQSTLEAGQNLMQVGVHAEALKGILYNLGSVAHGNGEKMVELSTMYARAVASGYVNSRMLIHEPALLQLIEHQVGKNGVAFKKYAATGQISLDVLNKALETATGEGGRFHDALENSQNTMAGHVAMIHTKMEGLGNKIYTALAPVIIQMIDLAEVYLPKIEGALRHVWHGAKDSDVLTTALHGIKLGLSTIYSTSKWVFELFENHKGLFYSIAAGVIAYKAAMLGAATVTEGVALWTTLVAAYDIWVLALAESTSVWAAAQLWLNVVMSANPIALAIAGIGALVAGVIYAWNHFEGFRKFLFSLWDTFKQVFSNIGDFFKEIFSPIAQFLADFKAGSYGAAAGDLAKLAFNLSPVGLAVKGAQFVANGGITKGVGDAWAKGQKEGHDNFIAGGVKNSLAGKPDSKTGESHNGSGTGSEFAEGGAGTIGGASGKNITFNIQSLIKEVHIHTTTAAEGIHQTTDKLKKALIAVTNDAETAMGGN